MYLWKCWRDTRSTFLVFLGAVLAVGLFRVYTQSDPFGWIAAKPPSSRILWEGLSAVLVASLHGMIPVAGFILGALGVGTEFEKRAADFLLTRPRPRPWLFWTSWSLGASQMLALALAGLAMIWIAKNPPDQRLIPEANGRIFAAILVVGLVNYSVTYLMTTLSRKGLHGLGLGLLTIAAYAGLCLWLQYWYEIKIPFYIEQMITYGRGAADLPLAVIAGWTAVGLALTAAAQWVFERAET